jgi:outer membrane protein, heavy metal efflux system
MRGLSTRSNFPLRLAVLSAILGWPDATEQARADPPPNKPSTFATECVPIPGGKPVRAAFADPALATDPKSGPVMARAVGLDDLVRIALDRNPRLGRATFAIDAARGRTLQAGLYPNPVLSATADELNDRQGRGGIITAPYVSQEIVTGGKLSLSQAVSAKEVDQATLALLAERYGLIAAIRAAYAEAYMLQRRVEILDDLARLAEQSAASGKKMLDGGLIPELDFLQLEIEQERVRANLESARKELTPVLRRLAATVGDPQLPVPRLAPFFAGDLPEYDLEAIRAVVTATHPTVRAAKVGVERAQLAARRAEVDWLPNVTVSGGYTRQNQNKSNDYSLGVSLPIPVWNRNQGNILAAAAEVGGAARDVGRVEIELAERVATAFRTFAAAKETADRYGKGIIPRAERSFQLSTAAFKGGQFEYLRVLQAQRALAEARLEYVRATGEAWRAAGEMSGLLLEEIWPPVPPSKK